MNQALVFAALLLVAIRTGLFAQQSPETKQLAAQVSKISPSVAAEADHDQLRKQLSRSLREQIVDSPFVQVPLESIVPGVLCEVDLPDLVAALAPRDVALERPADGRGRLVPESVAKAIYGLILEVYGETANQDRVQFFDEPPRPRAN